MRDFSKLFMINGDKWYNDKMMHMSYSQMDCFASCSMKWYLKYIKHLPEPASIYLAFGNVYHSMWEEFLKDLSQLGSAIYKSESIILQKLEEVKNAQMQSEILDSIDISDDDKKVAKSKLDQVPKILCKYIMQTQPEILNLRLNDNDVPSYEFGLGIPILNPATNKNREDFYLQMWPDAVFRFKDGSIAICDHKTSASKYGDNKLKTSLQLALYAYGCEFILKENGIQYNGDVFYDVLVKTITPSIQSISKNVTQADIRTALIHVNSILNSINKCSYCPTTSDMAHNLCAFQDICFKSGDEQSILLRATEEASAFANAAELIMANKKSDSKPEVDEIGF